MDLRSLLQQIDAETARAFIGAARHVLDALLLETARAAEESTPAERDYESAALPRGTPPGGWLSHAELRRTTRAIAEAVAAEKWVEGMACTIQLLSRFAG